ncbi:MULTISPECIES: MaoC family dehydratase [unclassified Caulobacter]|jgi:acyl dehydratase|uniref:MaoC family dehydratase n=1 Tax=unclassified Caulobacter TaxID=2648921 RepID=UPI0006F6E3CD|nr:MULTISPECIES: MaoC family dehydratase [unclassified Caulobacter]KQV54712.1 dehydratase [Caulobacter sp. Root342]KQV64148.1 dehydratase [Caulobacter sp. Root343]
MAVVFETPQALLDLSDHPLDASDWLLIDQARIDGFGAVTGDLQWIHVDPERAKDGPFGTTIAHGYLTLALVNLFLPQIIEVRGFTHGVNVGADSLRFLAPVRVGSRLRGVGRLIGAVPAKGGSVQSTVRVTVEIEGEDKPACVVDTISRYYL